MGNHEVAFATKLLDSLLLRVSKVMLEDGLDLRTAISTVTGDSNFWFLKLYFVECIILFLNIFFVQSNNVHSNMHLNYSSQ